MQIRDIYIALYKSLFTESCMGKIANSALFLSSSEYVKEFLIAGKPGDQETTKQLMVAKVFILSSLALCPIGKACEIVADLELASYDYEDCPIINIDEELEALANIQALEKLL